MKFKQRSTKPLGSKTPPPSGGSTQKRLSMTKSSSSKYAARRQASSGPDFYSSSDSSNGSSDPFDSADEEVDSNSNSGLNQIINGVKNTLNLSLSRSKSNKSSKSEKSLPSYKKKQMQNGHGNANQHLKQHTNAYKHGHSASGPSNATKSQKSNSKNGTQNVMPYNNINTRVADPYDDDFTSHSSNDSDSSDSSSGTDDSDNESDSLEDKKSGKSKRSSSETDNDKGNQSAEDYSDDEDEGEEGYKVGGYHRVKVGEVYNQRYVVIKKLGWGHFSTVWMVKDKQLSRIVATSSSSSSSNNDGILFYAIKVQKSAEHYTEAAMDEVKLLDCIAEERKRVESIHQKTPTGVKDKDGIRMSDVVNHAHHVATLHDSFFHNGSNGKHMCMVFSMLDCNLLSVIKAYNYRGIPMPVVQKMIKGVAKGLDFLHRKCKIIHTDLKPENVLMQFPGQINSESDAVPDFNNGGKDAHGHLSDNDQDQTLSIEQLEAQLRDPKIPTEERKRIRKKLKKRRQREKKRLENLDDGGSDRYKESASDQYNDRGHTFSDDTMERLLNESTPKKKTKNAHERVLSRLSHSQFVMKNFSPRISTDGSEFSEVMDDMVRVSRPSSSELSAHFQLCSAQVGNRSGVAEVSFVLKAFVTEGEIADNVSAALGGIPWELSDEDGATREWRCGLSMHQSGKQSIATMFKLVQQGRKDIDDGLRKTWTHLGDLVSENLSGRDTSILSLSSRSRSFGNSDAKARASYSLFTVKFSVLSSMVVLGFLENRIPGLVFLNYKREEGSPPVDHVIFGPYAQRICKHPLAMKIMDTSSRSANDNNSLGSALFGFDLRMVKEFAARPIIDEDGGSSFELVGAPMEKVASWWHARQPIHDRVKAFMGLHPNADLIDMPLFSSSPMHKSRQVNHASYIEGGKPPSESTSRPSQSSKKPPPKNMAMPDSQTAAVRASQQPDLKDINAMMKSRAVVVDLGNACWTHRHFSEDIQTRQYRAPEVLVGHKYDTAADIWSLGCMCFELLTGDLLFDPREGPDYDRDEDHLAMIQELVGKMPKKMACTGKYSKNYFDRKGNLKHIKQLKFWPIQDVLHEKYHFPVKEANEVASFMLPLLQYDSKQRATALQCLQHKWLQDID
eukprot:CAMPEP_0194076222 /NCGR_PEP_ID=MMETSP0149-20130528/3061_1 /TAXON_ID=122233 /ORGANISM="Chaetoceros debilis, Strain MM31A-1" /LENGTH=1124 /DNA_ID=CAMNT_0038756911 /DNA_START=304 /DNA_END=3678 /DNA_ORIENTATION=-